MFYFVLFLSFFLYLSTINHTILGLNDLWYFLNLQSKDFGNNYFPCSSQDDTACVGLHAQLGNTHTRFTLWFLVLQWPKDYSCKFQQIINAQLFLLINYTPCYKHPQNNKIYIARRAKQYLPFASTWIELKGVMLSEISQEEKGNYHVVSLICKI